MTSRFLEALRDRVILGDGAMGTELLSRGVTSERSLAASNGSHPDLVLQIHREYVAAGAELIRTNTFTANRLRMAPDEVVAANLEGARLARLAAGPVRFVAGSVGPLHDLDASEPRRREAFEEQCRTLAKGGVDVLLLETFTDETDLFVAIDAARPTGLPIVAEMADPGIYLIFEELAQAGVSVAGLNCVEPVVVVASLVMGSGGPPGMFSSFPAAGKPGSYLAPDAFAPLADLRKNPRVRLMGGCCGTTAAHIRALARRMGR